MTQPTLPVLGGGERELRDGDRVRLRCGIDVTIERKECVGGKQYFSGQGGYFDWRPHGMHFENQRDQHEFDIVLILGQAEETHGDGTVTLRREVLGSLLSLFRDTVYMLSKIDVDMGDDWEERRELTIAEADAALAKGGE